MQKTSVAEVEAEPKDEDIDLAVEWKRVRCTNPQVVVRRSKTAPFDGFARRIDSKTDDARSPLLKCDQILPRPAPDLKHYISRAQMARDLIEEERVAFCLTVPQFVSIAFAA